MVILALAIYINCLFIFIAPSFSRQIIGRPSLFRIIQQFVTTNSLTFYEIYFLSKSTSDRVSFLKDYHDFKHKNISSLIKGISSIIVLNIGIVIKNTFEKGLELKNYRNEDTLLIFLTLILIAVNIRYVIKLNDCVREFRLAVRMYETLKH